MKKICAIILMLVGATNSHAQSNIEGYEYWFNNDFVNKTTTNVTATKQLLVNRSISTTGLTSGVHTFNFRSFDNETKYSGVVSSFFYKPSALENNPNPEIVAYEYWVDNSYGDAVLVSTAAQKQVNVNELISMGSLANGIHVFNIRFKDSRGLWSSTTSEFFYKMSPSAPGSSNLVSYEYWFDNDYENVVTTNTPVQSQVVVNEMLDAQTLPNGIHVFNIRFKDNKGLWSSTASQFFYKMPSSEPGSSNLVSYEYWFDNDYENAVTTNTATQSQVAINKMVDAQTLPDGIHVFNIRFKDSRGLWSSTTSQFFYKMAAQSVTNNLIAGYRYWLNNDFENAIVETLKTPVKQFSLIDNLDFTSIPKGDYTISFQFKDALGMWSSVTTDALTKKSLPVSDFSYTSQVECGFTTVTFTDLSIDGDEYLWDFGDGNSSTLANPIHTYYTPNTYEVSLTVRDALLGTENTKVLPIEINSLNTESSITETTCDSYTAPDGQVYTTSGIKTAIIPNAAGCDSTITIDLTILHSTESSIAETACDSYTAPDGEVYTTSGIKTAVIPNAAGCDSTITIDLTILHSTASSITATACDSYTAPDGEVYTTSGIKTAVIPNAAGCDSTITIDLTILHSTESSIAETACDSYTAPDGEVYTTSGIKTAVIPNAAGCDSTITIDLTIINVDVSVTQDGITLTANATDASYQWLDCDNDYSAIAGETEQSFTATQNGNYAVEVTQDICVATSECYALTGVGVIENTFANEIIVYPNPTRDIVKVDLGKVLDEFTVIINDVNGKLVRKSTYKDTQTLELNLNVQPGVYLMTISSGDKKATIKLIKN